MPMKPAKRSVRKLKSRTKGSGVTAKKVRKAKTAGNKRSAPRVSEKAVRDSKAFHAAKSKAEAYANDPEKLRKLFEKATKKSKTMPRGPFAETWAYFKAMLRLIRAFYAETYREIPWQSLILILVAVIYVVNPIDIIPDVFPGVGYIDDAFVVALVLKSVKDDLDKFMEWETSQNKGEG